MDETAIEVRRDYVIIWLCRNESGYMREILTSVFRWPVRPMKRVIVDDGSTDHTSNILGEYSAKYDWIEIINRNDRGHRAVGAGVIAAFYTGFVGAFRFQARD